MGKKTIFKLRTGLLDILELTALIEDEDASIKAVRKRWEKVRKTTWPEL